MSQRGLILRLLQEAGPDGVDTHELIYRHGITQPAARIHELRTMFGHEITTVDHGTAPDGRRRLVSYVLAGAEKKPPPPPFEPAPPPADLPFPCGCVRASHGMSWRSRCERHTEGATSASR